MKKQMLLFTALCVLAGVAVLPAYSQTGGVKVNVPFSFAMGDKTYPAGEYAFSPLRDTIAVQNSDGATVAMVLANHTADGSAGKTGKAIFECYGDQCFISQIWIAGRDEGRQLLRSRVEVQVAAKQSAKYMALLGTSSQH